MKKLFCLLPLICTLSWTLPVSAQVQTHNGMLITTDYKENGVYYEIYDENNYTQQSGKSRFITREVVYDGKVTPPREISWLENINNLSYIGTLYLGRYAYSPNTNKTTASYQGVITPK